MVLVVVAAAVAKWFSSAHRDVQFFAVYFLSPPPVSSIVTRRLFYRKSCFFDAPVPFSSGRLVRQWWHWDGGEGWASEGRPALMTRSPNFRGGKKKKMKKYDDSVL